MTTELLDNLTAQQRSLQSRLYKSDAARRACLTAYDELLATWQVEYQSTFVATDFGETHVIVCDPTKPIVPDSIPLVLIPGGQGTAGMWGPVMQTLGTNRQVLSLDLIDQIGRSRPSKVIKSVKDASLWLSQTLDGLGLNQVNLMGNSIGSFIAAQFALANPTRTNKLILSAPAATFAPVRIRYIAKVLLTLMSPFKRSKENFIVAQSNHRVDLQDPLSNLLIKAMSCTRVISKLTPTAFSEEDIASLAPATLAIFGEKDGVNALNGPQTIAKLSKLNPAIETNMITAAGHNFTPDDLKYCAELADVFLSEDAG